MREQIKYKVGEKVGECLFVRDSGWYELKDGKRKRLAIFLCGCGAEFESGIGSVKSLTTRSCGCLKERTHHKHGFSHHRLYNVWCLIKSRCFNEKSPNYKYYGGRGITLYEPWISEPKVFIEYLMTLPGWDNLKLSIDRIRNDEDYKPGNLKFSTHTEQMNNRRSNKILNHA